MRRLLLISAVLLAAGCGSSAVEISGTGEYRERDGLVVDLPEGLYELDVETTPEDARRSFYIQLHSTETGTHSGCMVAEYEDIARGGLLEIDPGSNYCPPGFFDVYVYDPYGDRALRGVDWTVRFMRWVRE